MQYGVSVVRAGQIALLSGVTNLFARAMYVMRPFSRHTPTLALARLVSKRITL